MQKFHGIELSEGSEIINLRIENVQDIDGVPDNIITEARLWYNSKLKKLQYTYLDKDNNLRVANLKTTKEGWKDLIGLFSTGKTNSNTAPLWADIGNGFYAWVFADNKDMEIQIFFHSTHDIDYTVKIFQHVHWLPLTGSTGTVAWKLEWKEVKGHSQGESANTPFTNSVILYGNANGLNGEHIITEADDTQALTLREPDQLLLFKVTRLASDPNDTFVGSIAGFMLDLHYFSKEEVTLGRNPNFDEVDLPVSI